MARFGLATARCFCSGAVWKLGKLNHVAIAVPDMEKASNFYRDVLGAEVSQSQVRDQTIKLPSERSDYKTPQ
jgi:predicted enzyme related to lactoylglutathione lyase